MFRTLPLRPRHYVVRLAIFDALKAVEYDHIMAGPRFIVTAGLRAEIGDEDDGFVSLPYAFEHEQRAESRVMRAEGRA
jgi:hypothetical protein